MDAEIKKKLEEIALKTEHNNPMQSFMSGAESAWTLAVEWERNRCIRIIEGTIIGSAAKDFLTPEEVK